MNCESIVVVVVVEFQTDLIWGFRTARNGCLISSKTLRGREFNENGLSEREEQKSDIISTKEINIIIVSHHHSDNFLC